MPSEETRAPGPVDDAELYSMFYHADPDPIVAFLERWAGTGPIRALDVGCGPGRLLGPLRAKGWDIDGCDPNASFCRAAGSTGANVACGGFSDLRHEAEYDVIYSVNDPFQYLLSFDARLDALERIHRALRAGGRFLIDISNFDWILANSHPPRPRTLRRGELEILCVTRHEIHGGIWTHIDEFEIRDASGRRAHASQVHRLAMVGFPELDGMLRAAQFQQIETWPSYEAEASARVNGPRIIATCSKQWE